MCHVQRFLLGFRSSSDFFLSLDSCSPTPPPQQWGIQRPLILPADGSSERKQPVGANRRWWPGLSQPSFNPLFSRLQHRAPEPPPPPKVEAYQGLVNDDTGLNGIRLHCTRGDRGDKHQDHTVESQSGMWGRWSEPTWCPPGGYLQRFSLRVEKIRGGMRDNMGATNIRFACSGGENLEGHGLSWGENGVWSPTCQKGLCGIQTKQELPRGALRDDTALNDVRFFCCRQ
ncbi:vitelline membrane outer layer protein 1 homolog isoform X1 [Paroedura picta]|uniref:vitelline membrane outer layer protein 1 homolog isoform X1 n=1 Tax=Paroedura picta TaxID=143630 RepID=UPI0040561187